MSLEQGAQEGEYENQNSMFGHIAVGWIIAECMGAENSKKTDRNLI